MDRKPENKAKIFKLPELANYQKETIISRTIIDREKGTITFFSFDKGQGLSEHKTPYDALLIIIEGKAEVVISGKRFELIKDDMIIMPANEIHSVRALENFKMLLIMIKV